MKKLIGTIIGTVIWGAGFSQTAQTGINTTTPQQTLHVSGTTSAKAVADGTTGKFLVTPTIRVEGLDKTNNPNPYSLLPAATTQTLPLYATSDGELVIGGNRVNKVLQTLPVSTPITGNGSIDALPGPPGVNINTVYPNVTATVPLKTQAFTLTRTSMVYISTSVSIGNMPFDTDSRALMYGIKLQFSVAAAGSGIPTGIPFASSTDSHTTEEGSNIPTGYYYFNVSKELKLTPGTYTLQVYGIGTASSSGANSFPYSIGLAGNDNINIIAIAL